MEQKQGELERICATSLYRLERLREIAAELSDVWRGKTYTPYAEVDFSRLEHTYQSDYDTAEDRELVAKLQRFYERIYHTADSIVRFPRDSAEQLRGVDLRVEWVSLFSINIDEKIRRKDYGDLLVEVISNCEKGTAGWAVNPAYKTSLIAYIVLPTNSVTLIAYPQLREYILSLLPLSGDWKDHRGYRESETRDKSGEVLYHTGNVALQWSDLAEAAHVPYQVYGLGSDL